MATSEPHLAHEILEEIFLRLPTPAALACSSTACPSFRRIITARSFLRRFRKLHPPPLLGFVSDKGGFHPAEESHPSGPLARALADAADFSYSFVPKPNDDGSLSPWSPRDVRDGRVLLECDLPFDINSLDHSSLSEIDAIFARNFTNLAVCDPISRRYVLLPPIPEEMTVQHEYLLQFEPMLIPIGEDEDEDEDETSFKVICTAYYKSKLVTFVFSSVTGQWCIAASPSWSSLGTVQPSWKRLDHFNYVRGCFYWTDLWKDKFLVLDTRIMEFSTVDFTNQPGPSIYMPIIVDGTKGALEMLTVVGDIAGDFSSPSFHLHHTAQQNDGESSSAWQLKNVMELPRQCLFSSMGAKEGFVFLRDALDPWENSAQFRPWTFSPGDDPFCKSSEDNRINFFSLEVKTFELKKVCRATYYNDRVHSYFGFPPSLSKPSL